MDERIFNDETLIEQNQFLTKDNGFLPKNSNFIKLREMLIPDEDDVEETNTMGLYPNILDRKNPSTKAFTGAHHINGGGDSSNVIVEELTVRNSDGGNLEIGASSARDKNKMHNYVGNDWQQQQKFSPMGVWEDAGSTLFPELLNNNNITQKEDQNDTLLSSPNGIRTKILSQSGFSHYFVKNTLKGKGVMYNGPPNSLVQIRENQNQNHQQKDSNPNQSKETRVVSSHVDDDNLTLREWLRLGRNKSDKSKSLHIFKQILNLVDSSHSQGSPLQSLKPSSFKLVHSNEILYIGSIKQLEHDQDFLGGNRKRRKKEDEKSAICRWPQFTACGGLKYGNLEDSGYGFNEESIPRRDDTYPNRNMLDFGGDPLEEEWYASPEDQRERCSTLCSNIYSLGVLLFELLANCESSRTHAVEMMNLRQRILPPSFLSENPKEAGFCLWLLHPDPLLRPTTRDILKSELLTGIQQSSTVEKLSSSSLSSIDQELTESDLTLHFLKSLKKQKQKTATKLLNEIHYLESDISEIHSTHPNHHPTFPKPGGSHLITNINHLEHVYFSMRSTLGVKKKDLESLGVKKKDSESLGVKMEDSESLGVKMEDSESLGVKMKDSESLGGFFKSLSKYARYSKFEVKGSLRNGDFNNMGNVICSIGFDRDEDYFATAGVSKKIKIYDFQDFLNDSVDIHYPAVEMVNKSRLSCICWNNYIRNYLASTDYDGVVKIWDAGTGEAISHHIEHEKRAWSVDFSRVDPKKLVSGGDDCTVKLWSINEKNSLTTIKSVANVCCVQLSPYSSHLLSFGSSDYKTYCYDLRNISTPLCTLVGHDRAVSYVKFLDSETVISASTDNTIKSWDLNKSITNNNGGLSNNGCVLTFKGHTNEKNFVGLSVTDGYIACGSETNEVFAYYRSFGMPITSHKFGCIDPISGKETENENENNQFVSSVCWREKSKMVVSANSSGCLKLLQMV